MRCPTLSDLPPSPTGKSGWPWTEDTPQLPETRPDGTPWPRISIVTPSYNQGQFIEETIRSILLQGYPNLEYIVIDGKSKDGTLSVLEKYSKFFNFWKSASDGGQSNAINIGLDHCSGDLFNWINSDDTLYPGALASVAAAYSNKVNAVISGRTVITNESGSALSSYNVHSFSPEEGLGSIWPNQPGGYLPLPLVQRLGGVREDLNFTMDMDLWMRLWASEPSLQIFPMNANVATYRLHDASKTQSSVSPFAQEEFAIRYDMMRSLGLLLEPNPLDELRRQLKTPVFEYDVLRTFDKNKVPEFFLGRTIINHPILRDVLRLIDPSFEQASKRYISITRWLADWQKRYHGGRAAPTNMLTASLEQTMRFDALTALKIVQQGASLRDLKTLIKVAGSNLMTAIGRD